MDLNKVMLIGNLTRDPETRVTPQGTNVCSFGLATNFVFTDASGSKQQRAEFHNIVAWRKLGEICQQYLKKGSKIFVEGRLQTRTWDGNDGKKNYRTEVIMDNMIMLDSRGRSAVGFAPGDSADNSPFSKDQFGKDEFSRADEIPTIQNDAPSQDQNSNEISVEDIPF